VDLNDWANVAQIASLLTILGGLWFGFVQLREFRRQRYDLIASELMRSFYDSQFAESVALVQAMADDLSVAEVRKLGQQYLTAVVKVAMTCETMGLLVYRRIAPFDLTLELVGGLVQVLWKKLERYTRELRAEHDHPSYAEWFEWLAAMCARDKSALAPAYERGASWQPK
jgi:hypothetical protein